MIFIKTKHRYLKHGPSSAVASALIYNYITTWIELVELPILFFLFLVYNYAESFITCSTGIFPTFFGSKYLYI